MGKERIKRSYIKNTLNVFLIPDFFSLLVFKLWLVNVELTFRGNV